jgi:hypothetical protein
MESGVGAFDAPVGEEPDQGYRPETPLRGVGLARPYGTKLPAPPVYPNQGGRLRDVASIGV